MASSFSVLTLQSLITTRSQQSMSKPSRLVSAVTSSISRSSTPVSSMAKCPHSKKLMPRTVTLRQSRIASALLACLFIFAWRAAPRDNTPVPSISPSPSMVTSCRSSPHIKELCQWLCPKSWYFESLGSASSYPSVFVTGAALITAPRSSLSVMFERRCRE